MVKGASTTILSLQNVSVPDNPASDVPLQDVSFALGAGELAAILLDPIYPRTPLPDVICGTLSPESGKACYQDRDWCRTRAAAAARLRGTIGRVFDQHAW